MKSVKAQIWMVFIGRDLMPYDFKENTYNNQLYKMLMQL